MMVLTRMYCSDSRSLRLQLNLNCHYNDTELWKSSEVLLLVLMYMEVQAALGRLEKNKHLYKVQYKQVNVIKLSY